MILSRRSIRAFSLLAGVAFAAGVLCESGAAAEVTKVLPKKKFKLHAIGIGFKTSDMAAKRVVPQPSYQTVGVIQGDFAVYSAEFDPPLTLPSNRYSWVGANFQNGATSEVTYSQTDDRAILVNILDKNSNTTKFVGVIAKPRSVGSQTESEYCLTSGTAIGIICATCAQDADLATAWSRTEQTGIALGYPGANSQDNGKGNAAMHAYWNYLMTRDGGADVAVRIGTAHEKFSVNSTGIDAGDPHNNSVMDLDNNARGRQLAPAEFQTTPGTNDPAGQAAVIAAANAGSLTKMDIVQNPGRGGLLEPSNK